MLLNGKISNVANIRRKDLEKVGLSPDFWIILDAIESWYVNRVPTLVALILWLVRTKQRKDGGWIRRLDTNIAETGIGYRYVQFASMLGETPRSDKYYLGTVKWFYDNILPGNEGYGSNELDYEIEIGTTARTARIFLNAIRNLNKDMLINLEQILHIIKGSYRALKKYESNVDEYLCWHHRPQKMRIEGKLEAISEKCTIGSTLLATLAYLEALELLSSDDVLDEIKSTIIDVFGENATDYLRHAVQRVIKWVVRFYSSIQVEDIEIDIIYYTLKVFYGALTQRIISIEEIRDLLETIISNMLHKLERSRSGNFYSLAFFMRALTISTKLTEFLGGFSYDKLKEKALRILKIYFKDETMKDILKDGFDTYHLLLIGIAILEVLNSFDLRGLLPTQNRVITKLEKEILSKEYILPKNPPPFIMDKLIKKLGSPTEILYKWANNRIALKVISILVAIDILVLPAIAFAQYAILKMFVEIGVYAAIIDVYNALQGGISQTSAIILVGAVFAVWIWLQLLFARNKVFRLLAILSAVVVAYLSIAGGVFLWRIDVLGEVLFLAIIIDAASNYLKRGD